MKTVFENAMVAHVWAQQSQPEGRSNNGQFYFRDATIYSYGSHFPIARFEKTRDGKPYVLFTTRSYSMTTAKHINFTHRAIPHGTPIFYVRNLEAGEPRDQWQAEIDAAVRRAACEEQEGKRNHKKRALAALGEAGQIAEAANRFAEFTGARWRLKAPGATPEALAAATAAHERAVKAIARKKTKEEAERAKEQAEKQALWLAGEDVRYSLRTFDAACGGAALRVKGDELETSHGARVPLAHAIKAFRFLKLCKERGETWHKNGHSIRVGHFTIDAIEADGSFRAGCHNIRWPEVERIARQIGVFDETASRDALEPSHHAA